MEIATPDAAIAINNATDVAEARRVAAEILRGNGAAAAQRENCALVVTELGTNLIKHAGGGTLVLRVLPSAGLEILSLDHGPGMESPERCFQDGYSSGGTMGTGLGAVGRLSSHQIYSRPGQGTVLAARVGEKVEADDFGVISVPYPGETLCGDAWSVIRDENFLQITVADGLGHGAEAAKASALAIEASRERVFSPPDQLLHNMHPIMRQTRGAAVSIARVDFSDLSVQFAGAGNVAGSVTSPSMKIQRMVSMNGTVGLEIRRIQPFRYQAEPGSLLILHSDGLSTRWSIDQYQQLQGSSASIIAGVLFRDHRRMQDDATVVVVHL